jgi:hypothetical protein
MIEDSATPMDLVEIYVLCEARSATAARLFLETCLPARTALTNEYPFPQFDSSPSNVFRSPEELILHLESRGDESYSIYWDSKSDEGPRQAMLFFTTDGAMIAGLVVRERDAHDAILHLAQRVNGRFAYIDSSNCPPDNSEGFIEVCRKSTLTNLFDGRLRQGLTPPE